MTPQEILERTLELVEALKNTDAEQELDLTEIVREVAGNGPVVEKTLTLVRDIAAKLNSTPDAITPDYAIGIISQAMM